MNPKASGDLLKFRAILADDAYAISFQSFGQYRTALLRELDRILASSQPQRPIVCQECNMNLNRDGYCPNCGEYKWPTAIEIGV